MEKRIYNKFLKLKNSCSISHINRKEFLVLLVISLYIFLFFKPVISGDGFGYYSILEGVVKDHTLNFVEQDRYDKMINLNYVYYNNVTHKYVSKYPFGLPLLSAPLYSLSLFLDDFSFFHIKDDFFIREKGDILIHQASVALTSLLFVYIALLLSIKIIKEHVSKEYAALSVLLIFFSSPLLRYATYDLSYTHGVEAGLMAIIVLLILRNSNPLYIGGFIGLLTTVRYTSLVFLIPIGAYFLYYKKHRNCIKLILGAMPFFLLLMGYSLVQFGGLFSTGYVGDIQKSPLLPIHVLDILFDLERGMIWWTPNLLIAIYGLFLIKDNKKWIFIGFFMSYLIGYGMYGEWHSAWSFGNRFFVVFFPIFCIGIATFLKNLPKFKPLIYSLAIYTGFLSLLFLAHTEDPEVYSFLNNVNYWFLEGNIIYFPKLLIKKIAIYRFLFEG